MTSFIDLPDVVLEHIFSFLTYDAVAQNRIVCKCFNTIGGRVLNKGFYAVEKFNSRAVRDIKTKLPRRESERRNHPLERQCSILISVETRINMLAMTFSKWINNDSCCFIPGKVIDEIYRVVRNVMKNTEITAEAAESLAGRAHEILQELRDISSMAIEHFDDKILPQLKRNYYRSSVESVVEADDVLDGLIKRGSQLTSMLPVIGCLRSNKFPSSSLIQTPISSDAVAHPHYLRLLIRESVNRFRLQAQAVQISSQAKDIEELRKQVQDWEEKFKELSTVVLKQSTSSTTLVSTKPLDESECSTSRTIDSETTETATEEDEKVSLKRKVDSSEDVPNTSSKIMKLMESVPSPND